MTSATDEVDKFKGELNVANTESALQFVKGFKAEIKQVKVIVRVVNFEEVGPFKEVADGKIVDVIE